MAKLNIVRLRDEMRTQAEAERTEFQEISTDDGATCSVERRPLMREKPAPEPYPIDTLLELKPFAEAAQGITQVPIEMAAHGVLGPVNYAIQGHVDTDFGFGSHPVSLFLVCSAESGERKSAIYSICMRGVYAHQSKLLIEADSRDADEKALSPIFVVTEPTIDAVLAHFSKSIGSL